MKKYIFIIGGLIIAVALILSVMHWNKEVDHTTEKAKEDLTNIVEKDPQSSGKHPSTNDQDPTINNGATNKKDSTTTSDASSNHDNQNDSTITKDASSNYDNQNDSNTASNDPAITEEETQQDAHQPNGTPITEADLPETEGKSLSEIKSAYQRVFTDLEIQEASTLDQLLVQAKADYVSGKYSKSKLIDKYGSTASQLERQADQSFQALYSLLQSDLSKSGYDPNEASPFKSEYNRKKQARLSHAITQLEGF